MEMTEEEQELFDERVAMLQLPFQIRYAIMLKGILRR